MAIEITSGDIFTNEQLGKHAKIYAGPGAGKTHFLVENVKHIITTYPLVAQSRQRKVLCITYTNAAVDEIKRRLDRYADSVEAYTIHGFIIEHIIKPFQQDLQQIMQGDFGIAVSEKGQITSQVEGLGILHGVDKDEMFQYIIDITSEANKPDYSKKIMGDISIDIDAYSSDPVKFAARCTSKKFKASSRIAEQHILPIKEYVWSVIRKLTHDEILYFGYQILEKNHTALYATRVRFPFVFVDEFQDTNPLQTKLINMIGEKSTVIGIIGDLAQSIYSFQGAKPSQFAGFALDSGRELVEYVINRNRRSTANIVNFCNYLRQSDINISQISMKPYADEVIKQQTEDKKVHFITGSGDMEMSRISQIVADGGVVLTRTWAAAFAYISGVTQPQIQCLSRIYNSYFTSPIDIRRDIEEHNFVTWVRAFKFIFSLWNGFRTGSFVDVLRSFSYYWSIEPKLITPKLISHIKGLSTCIFEGLSDSTTDKITTNVIDDFNAKTADPQFSEIIKVLGSDFKIPVFDDADREDLKNNVNGLNWQTSYKLFTEVFSVGSKYMTVHQAKGLEWEKVVVSLTPNSRSNRDNITLNHMFQNPQLLAEDAAQEFTRMYYVACSRAKEDLYIHLPGGFDRCIIETALSNFTTTSGQNIDYEFI
ncbi:MAG: ATP-dependent helicase [Firmicutes bacterium]|nr:ATP-dependent helicase [Bacillota bacterium]MCL5993040.1 ATP-dependent helicase [Bacillota bacterium]